MKSLFLTIIIFISGIAQAADFTITVKASGKKLVYYSDSTRIGEAILPGNGIIDTSVGPISTNSLKYPTQTGRYYVGSVGGLYYDHFLDADCKVPLIPSSYDAPARKSVLNVYNGYVKFIGGSLVPVSGVPQYKLSSGGNNGSCIQDGSFSGSAWDAASYTSVTIPFTPGVITAEYE